MRLLAAPDKFRGTLTAPEAADAIAAGAQNAGWESVHLPLADGGEGTLDALGGPNRTTTVTGPGGRPVDAAWRLDGEFAVIETAQASGLALAGGAKANDPLAATSRGTGELVQAAIDAGAHHIIVAVGGSATTDGGLPALEALGFRRFDERAVHVSVACDVDTPFTEAATVFAPQKGANSSQVRALKQRLLSIAGLYHDQLGLDVTALPRAGAAGGLAGGLAALGAHLEPGFELVAHATGLDHALAQCQLVVTGEGRLDATSLAGKVIGGVLTHAAHANLPALVIAGEIATRPQTNQQVDLVSLVERFGASRAWNEPAACVTEAVTDALPPPSSDR